MPDTIVLVTGASRGLGLEFVRQWSQRPDVVVWAGARDVERADALMELAEMARPRVRPIALDVTSTDHVRDVAARIGAESGRLDVLINNAGCFAPGESDLATVRPEAMLDVFAVNAVAPLILAHAMTELLEKSARARVANLVSGAGVLTDRWGTLGNQYSYAASKAALNLVTRKMAFDLKPRGIAVIGLAPGYVLTDMTRASPHAPSLLPEDSVAGMLRVLDGLMLDQSGQFIAHNGDLCRWMLTA